MSVARRTPTRAADTVRTSQRENDSEDTHMRRFRMTSTVLGLLSVAAVGCGGAGGDNPRGEGNVGTDSAAGIAAFGAPIFGAGCLVTQAFNVTSPQVIDFIAAAATNSTQNQASSTSASSFSNQNSLQAQLFNVDTNGVWTQVNQQATQVSSNLQQLINSSTLVANAAQQSSSAFANSAFT